MIHFQRANSSEGYIEAIIKFLRNFVSCNNHNAKFLSYYYIQIKNLTSGHLSVEAFLKEEGFTVPLTGKAHS